MSWLVHRRQDSSIAVAMKEALPGYSLTPGPGELQLEVVPDTDPEIVARLAPIDRSNADNLEKVLKAILLAAASMAGKTPTQARSAFFTAWNALP